MLRGAACLWRGPFNDTLIRVVSASCVVSPRIGVGVWDFEWDGPAGIWLPSGGEGASEPGWTDQGWTGCPHGNRGPGLLSVDRFSVVGAPWSLGCSGLVGCRPGIGSGRAGRPQAWAMVVLGQRWAVTALCRGRMTGCPGYEDSGACPFFHAW